MRSDIANILSFFDGYAMPNVEDIGKSIAADFRARRIEKGLTRADVASMASVPVANVARFEQKGLISLSNLIGLAMAMGYTPEVKSIFSESKYDTIEELMVIRKNRGKKKACHKSKKS